MIVEISLFPSQYPAMRVESESVNVNGDARTFIDAIIAIT
jgi:hypothetical protein